MAQLTIDELARRAMKRRNRKIAERYPLLADQLATSVEAEKERIIRQHKFAEQHAAAMCQSSLAAWECGLRYREVARAVLPADSFAERERIWRKFNPVDRPEYDGGKLADWWWCALKGTKFAAENCPNRDRHHDPDWYAPHWNHLLQTMVETTECPTCGYVRGEDGGLVE